MNFDSLFWISWLCPSRPSYLQNFTFPSLQKWKGNFITFPGSGNLVRSLTFLWQLCLNQACRYLSKPSEQLLRDLHQTHSKPGGGDWVHVSQVVLPVHAGKKNTTKIQDYCRVMIMQFSLAVHCHYKCISKGNWTMIRSAWHDTPTTLMSCGPSAYSVQEISPNMHFWDIVDRVFTVWLLRTFDFH